MSRPRYIRFLSRAASLYDPIVRVMGRRLKEADFRVGAPLDAGACRIWPCRVTA